MIPLPTTGPDSIEHHLRQGSRYFVQERFREASRSFRQAASLPGGRELWRWKSLGFCPSVFSDAASIDDYWNRLDRALDLAYEADVPITWKSLPADGFTPSFNLPHLGRCCRSIKEKFARLFRNVFPFDRPTFAETRRGRRKIRIGFVVTAGHQSGFFRVYRPLLESLDPKRFEVFLICSEAIARIPGGPLRNERIVRVSLPKRFSAAVATLRETRCDILFHWKVGGGTLDYFLAFARAAPVQCTSYGCHGTSGVPAVDYFLSTSLLETETAREHYTEKLVLLNEYPTFHELPERLPAGTRAEFDLPSGALYCCPHRLAKYHPDFDALLQGILERDATGHLLVLTGSDGSLARQFAERLRRTIGASLFQRVLLRPAMPWTSYRKLLSTVDCVLDSPAYAGDLTTHDALAYGIPVVTRRGSLLVQRYTAGLYDRMELGELIAKDRNDYIGTAIRLGTDKDYREAVQRRIRERREAAFSPSASVSEYERFFESVIE